jgi:hypothetical protein
MMNDLEIISITEDGGVGGTESGEIIALEAKIYRDH